jgi:poly(3-hydroxybutyrate) depolymerase
MDNNPTYFAGAAFEAEVIDSQCTAARSKAQSDVLAGFESESNKMRQLMTYDLMETVRNTNQWIGASAQAMASYPIWGVVPNPMFKMMAAWGEVTERSFSRMVTKPDWGIDTVVASDGRDHIVSIQPEVKKPFGDLIRFRVNGRPEKPRRILLVAPMSGHYATLLRSTVQSLLPDSEVWITDWHNARDIPVSKGKFDIEDYTLYLSDFIRHLGPDTNVIAVCQPAPLALAATAYLAAEDPKAQPRTLTLIGGPIDPDAARTDVTDFGRRVTMGQLEQLIIQRVGFKYAGVGRMVYPGLLQLASFMSMNGETHSTAFTDQILRVAKGKAGDHDKHNKFYDEYLAVMDMTAEFYLSTVDRIFKQREIARNDFEVAGRKVDIGSITNVAVKVVEGERDDISAPGQCLAALDLLTGLPDNLKASHLEPGAGHYGIFAGKSWRNNIRPLVLDFIDANTPGPAKARKSA